MEMEGRLEWWVVESLMESKWTFVIEALSIKTATGKKFDIHTPIKSATGKNWTPIKTELGELGELNVLGELGGLGELDEQVDQTDMLARGLLLAQVWNYYRPTERPE